MDKTIILIMSRVPLNNVAIWKKYL